MKPILKKLIWISALLALAVITLGAFNLIRLWANMHADPCPAPQIHLAATGFEAINKDAQSVFERYVTAKSDGFYPLHELDSYPALNDLTKRFGDYSVVIFEPKQGEQPEHLRIRCGNHFNCHFIYVFDSRISLSTNNSLFQGKGWQQVTNNFFLRM